MSWMEEQDDRECEYGYLESSAIKNLELRLSHLSAVNEKLVEALKELLSAEKLDDGDPILDKARIKADTVLKLAAMNLKSKK